MKCFVMLVLSLVVLVHVILADDDGFDDDLTFDERQTLRRNGKIYRSNRRGRGKKGEVERDAKVLVKRDESLQRRMESVQDNDESDVEKRERGWLKSSRVLNSGQEEVLLKRLVDDLEKAAFEKREQGWASNNERLNRGELLEKRLDQDEDEEESDLEIERREQGWASKNERLNIGELLEKRLDQDEDEEESDLEIERREQGWASKNERLNIGELLEKRMDEIEDEEPDVQKREQGWAIKNDALRRGEELEKRMDQAEEILDLEKRQLNKPNPNFKRFGRTRL